MISNKKTSVSGNEIAVDLSVTLGTADLRVQQLLKLGRGAVVELDRVLMIMLTSTPMTS